VDIALKGPHGPLAMHSEPVLVKTGFATLKANWYCLLPMGRYGLKPEPHRPKLCCDEQEKPAEQFHVFSILAVMAGAGLEACGMMIIAKDRKIRTAKNVFLPIPKSP
jgi:hypothetical protein